jgi:MFS transporter, OFA family, oxalate/formate antiporter
MAPGSTDSGSAHPHRWFPGYTVAGAATVAYIATAPGQTFVVSQLNGPLRDAFGIGELTLNTSYAIATVLASFPLVLVGRWTDRVGPRRALAWTAMAFGLACVFMSLVTGFWGVVAAFFLLRFLGQGALSMVSQHATAMWFHRRLGAIHGIKQVAVFGIWVLFPQGALWLITTVGWRWTYVVFAGAVWVSVIPLALLAVRDRPEELGLRMDDDPPEGDARAPGESLSPAGDRGSGHRRGGEDGATRFAGPMGTPAQVAPPVPEARSAPSGPHREAAFSLSGALRTRAYWILAAAVFLSPLIGTAFLFDMQPILARRGMDAGAAALAVSAWSAGMALMALPAGYLADRVRPSRLIPGGLAGIAGSSLLLWWAPLPLAAAAAMALFAVGQSLVATSSTTSIARYFGRTHHGAIRASVVRLGVVGTGLGPVFTGLSANRTGGYLAATLLFLAMCAPVLLLSTGLREPPSQAPVGG